MTAPDKPGLSNEELKPCGECGHRHYYTDVCGSILNPTENAVYFRHCECDGDPKSLGKPFRRAQEAPQGERELKPEVQAALSGGGDERWVLSERGHKIICEDGKLRKPTPESNDKVS